MTCADVTMNALSVAQCVDCGLSAVFSPQGSYLTSSKVIHPQEDISAFRRKGNLYYLEMKERSKIVGDMIAPIAEPENQDEVLAPFDDDVEEFRRAQKNA